MWTTALFLLLAFLPADVGEPSPPRLALVVGIDRYVAPPGGSEPLPRRWRDLSGSVNDAEAVARLLAERYGFDVKLLVDADATRAEILTEIDRHLISPATKDTEAVFYFAGHGSQVVNSKSEERDKMDETLVPADASKGVSDIRDKELRARLNRVLDRGARLTVILDTCHSGSGVRGLPGGRSARYLDPAPGDAPDIENPGPPLEERDTLILSAAQDFERAWEMADENGESHGAFTLSLLRALGTAAPSESASDVFLRARARLRAEGFQQEPVIAGSPRLRAAPLFGGRSGRAGIRVAVLDAQDDGTMVLQGGWATGLSPGSELRRAPRGDDEPVQMARIVSAELTRSRAELISSDAKDSAPRIEAGDLFELTRWAVPEEANLRVWMPTMDATGSELVGLVGSLAEITDTPRLRWIEDPVEETPTHVLSWNGGTWLLRSADGREHDVGSRPDVESLRGHLRKKGAGVRLFVHVPLPRALRSEIRLGADAHDAIEIVHTPDRATYVLAGRLRDGRLEYAWVRPEVAASDAAVSSLPLRSRWLALDETTKTGRALEDLALRLGKIRAWQTLEPPRTDAFPYRLALKNSTTRKLEPDDSGGRLRGGDRYGLVLRARPEDLIEPISPLYVYAFLIDSYGRSRLLFPRGSLGSVENRLPVTLFADMPLPTEIPIGPQPLLEISEPWGIDTYFLLTTSEPVPDPFVLDSAGVMASQPIRGRTPLDRLLRRRGAPRRGERVLLPTTWSLYRVSFEVVPPSTAQREGTRR